MHRNSPGLAEIIGLAPLVLTSPLTRAAVPPASEVLFRDVHVFDGKSAGPSGRTDVRVRGNTTADMGLIADPAKNVVVIMKYGRIYKNTSRPLSHTPGADDHHADE